MPMRTDRTKRGRNRRSSSDLDWFGEDPWAERGEMTFGDGEDDWDLDSLQATDEESAGFSADGEDDQEGSDDWGPIRHRRERGRGRESR